MRLGPRQLRLDGGERALIVQYDLKGLAPGLVAQACDAGRFSRLGLRAPQRFAAIKLAGVARQGAFRFLQRAQPGTLEIGESPVGTGLRLCDSGAADD